MKWRYGGVRHGTSAGKRRDIAFGVLAFLGNPPQASTDLDNSADTDLSATYWEYIPPTPESPAPWTKSLDAMLHELPKDMKT